MPTAYAATLSARHAELDQRIDREAARPRPDEVLLAMLKKQKLRLKEMLNAR